MIMGAADRYGEAISGDFLDEERAGGAKEKNSQNEEAGPRRGAGSQGAGGKTEKNPGGYVVERRTNQKQAQEGKTETKTLGTTRKMARTALKMRKKAQEIKGWK